MNIIDLRKKCRRYDERRVDDRRKNPFKFGTPEWVGSVEKSYLMWPKTDRRVMVRRTEERRSKDRRDLQFAHYSRPEKSTTMNILTREEKELFVDIFRDDA